MGRVKALAFVVLLALSGCTVRHGDFTVLSNKMVRLSDFELEKADRVRKVVGEDKQHIIVIIPTGGEPTLDGALDKAFQLADGDVMTDVVVESWGWYIPYIYGQTGWRVTGDVVKTRKN
ncbi:MAG: hypothetical protein ACK5GN_03035 [Pseudomonadota bacterium]|jgi:hypothetical protein